MRHRTTAKILIGAGRAAIDAAARSTAKPATERMLYGDHSKRQRSKMKTTLVASLALVSTFSYAAKPPGVLINAQDMATWAKATVRSESSSAPSVSDIADASRLEGYVSGVVDGLQSDVICRNGDRDTKRMARVVANYLVKLDPARRATIGMMVVVNALAPVYPCTAAKKGK